MTRDKLIDIVKAIGIISIVIGHSAWTVTKLNIKIGPFVYMYHLMIFVFTAGYLIKFIKHIKNKKESKEYERNAINKCNNTGFQC